MTLAAPLAEHRAVCAREEVECSHDGCGVQMLREDVEAHDNEQWRQHLALVSGALQIERTDSKTMERKLRAEMTAALQTQRQELTTHLTAALQTASACRAENVQLKAQLQGLVSARLEGSSKNKALKTCSLGENQRRYDIASIERDLQGVEERLRDAVGTAQAGQESTRRADGRAQGNHPNHVSCQQKV